MNATPVPIGAPRPNVDDAKAAAREALEIDDVAHKWAVLDALLFALGFSWKQRRELRPLADYGATDAARRENLNAAITRALDV